MDFADPHFAEPARLVWMAPLLLALIVIATRASFARGRAIGSLASPVMLKSLLAAHSPERRVAKQVIFGVACALIVVALARPRWGREPGETADKAEDVVFLLDTSRSMTARDVSPDRLTRAKRAIATFVAMHPSGRIGLVAFAGKAFLQCPPTADRDIFNETLEEMDTDVIPQPGTNIGEAIGAGFSAFGETTDKTRRTIVLLTDGEDLARSGVETARKLAREGVVIHTVGIGGSGYELPSDASGTGGKVTTRLDETTLREIAATTGGEYFHLGSGNDTFASVESRLGIIATREEGGHRAVERYETPLAVAAALLAFEALMGTRRRTPGRSLAPLLIAVAAILPVGAPPARAESSSDRFDEAARAIRNKEWSAAEDLLKIVLEDNDEALRSPALFNLGQARARAATPVVDKHLASGSPAADLRKTYARLKNALADVTGILDRHAKGDFDAREAAGVYMRSRETRKDALKRMKAVREALSEATGATKKLERARDDFLGSHELAPDRLDAKTNAEAVDAYLNRFRKTLEKEARTLDDATKTAAELKRKLAELRRLLDPSGGSGEGEDDDDGDGEKQNPGSGDKDIRPEKEKREQEGAAGKFNRDEAMNALEQMRPDLRGRVPSDFGRPGKDADARENTKAGDR